MNKSKYGWVVLLGFTLLAGVSQMLWLNFAPILSVVQKKYEISELMASSLILVFPIFFVILSIPAGLMIDKKGYRSVMSIAAIITSLSAILRIFDSNFYFLLAGQIGVALAQPFIMNGISKLVADWFEKNVRALATGLGTIGMFVGMAFSMAVTPTLVQGIDIQKAMIVFAAITVVASVFFILVARETGASTEPTAGSWDEIKILLKNRNLILVFIISFLALGFFNSFTNWIELILAQQGINSEQAGMIGGVMIIGGIIGSAIIPAISDKLGRRKPFLVICAIMATSLIYPLAKGGNVNVAMVLGGLFGALVLPAFALLLTMSEEEAGHEKAGAATGFLMLVGNGGTVLITVLMKSVISSDKDWSNAIYLLLGVIIVAVVMSFMVKETFKPNHS